MSKTKKIIWGTMLVASLAGGKLNAQNNLAPKTKAKTEQTSKTNANGKEFRDPGVLVAMRGNNLIFEIDDRKFSKSVQTQKYILEKISDDFAMEYSKDMKADDPYNSDYFSQDKLNLLRDGVQKTQREVVDRLLNLPLEQKRYEEVKGKLIALFLMTRDCDIMMADFINDISEPQAAADYIRFARTALRINIGLWMIKEDVKEIQSAEQGKSASAVMQKAKERD